MEPQVNQIKEHIDSVKRAAKEIERREQALKAYLERRNLTMDEFYNDPDKSDRVLFWHTPY